MQLRTGIYKSSRTDQEKLILIQPQRKPKICIKFSVYPPNLIFKMLQIKLNVASEFLSSLRFLFWHCGG